MKYLLMGILNTFNTKSRSSLKEFWMFFLFLYLIDLLLLISFFLLYPEFQNTYRFEINIIRLIIYGTPLTTAGIRRMHDVGKSGFFLLVPLYNLYLLLSPSERLSNKWGAYTGKVMGF